MLVRDVSGYFEAVASDSRLKVVMAMHGQESLTYAEISEVIGKASVANGCLRRLYRDGIIDKRREGIHSHYYLTDVGRRIADCAAQIEGGGD